MLRLYCVCRFCLMGDYKIYLKIPISPARPCIRPARPYRLAGRLYRLAARMEITGGNTMLCHRHNRYMYPTSPIMLITVKICVGYLF